MEENPTDKFHEEIMKKYSFMSDAVQIYFLQLSHRFIDHDRSLRPGEKIKTVLDLFR